MAWLDKFKQAAAKADDVLSRSKVPYVAGRAVGGAQRAARATGAAITNGAAKAERFIEKERTLNRAKRTLRIERKEKDLTLKEKEMSIREREHKLREKKGKMLGRTMDALLGSSKPARAPPKRKSSSSRKTSGKKKGGTKKSGRRTGERDRWSGVDGDDMIWGG
ncbi:hypothetical protein [Methanocella sp. MCL-LM]|uniref:hypothetical protein n=1 Tax=Methanocella sp. MCL-LM TaxID=3412035 RepID=UPI003C71690A